MGLLEDDIYGPVPVPEQGYPVNPNLAAQAQAIRANRPPAPWEHARWAGNMLAPQGWGDVGVEVGTSAPGLPLPARIGLTAAGLTMGSINDAQAGRSPLASARARIARATADAAEQTAAATARATEEGWRGGLPPANHNAPPEVLPAAPPRKLNQTEQRLADRDALLNERPPAQPGDPTAAPTGEFQLGARNADVTWKGLQPHQWTPQHWQEFGEHHGVPNLGGLRTPVEVKTTDGATFNVPGGLNSKDPFSYYELLYLKAQGLDPNRLSIPDHAALQHRMLASVTPNPTDDLQRFSGTAMGMTSPNNPLLPNQLAMTRLRPRSMEDVVALGNMIPWKAGDTVSKEVRKAADERIANELGIDSGAKGGLGVRGSADYTRLAEHAQRYAANPTWYQRRPGEPWDEFTERTVSQTPGLSLKTGSFSNVWQDPAFATISAVDRHMANNFGPGRLFPDKAAEEAWRGKVVDRWNKNVGLSKEERDALEAGTRTPRPQVKSFDELRLASTGDTFVQDQLLSEVGRHGSPQARVVPTKRHLAAGYVPGPDGKIDNPAIPAHLRSGNAQWIDQPEQVSTMSPGYRRALAHNATEAQQQGLELFGSQWLMWDRIRNRLEPHENMFPGLERLPRMSDAQLKQVLRSERATGEMTYGKVAKDADASEVKSLQPRRPILNPSRIGYFTVPAIAAGAAGRGGLLDEDRR